MKLPFSPSTDMAGHPQMNFDLGHFITLL